MKKQVLNVALYGNGSNIAQGASPEFMTAAYGQVLSHKNVDAPQFMTSTQRQEVFIPYHSIDEMVVIRSEEDAEASSDTICGGEA